MNDIDAGHRLEKLSAEMARCADAGAGKVHFARLCFRESDQLFDALDRHARRHDQHTRDHADAGDRRKILNWVVRQIFHEIRIDDLRTWRTVKQRVAIGQCLGDEIGADGCPAAGSVVHQDDFSQALAKRTGDDTRHRIRGSSRGEGDDQPDRPRGIALRGCTRGAENECAGCECHQPIRFSLHHRLLLLPISSRVDAHTGCAARPS